MSDRTVGTVCQTHGVQIHPVELQLVPDLPLQLSRDGAVTAVPAEDESPVIF